MYCSNCGAKAGGNFCSGCGQRLTMSTSPTPPSIDWENEIDPQVVLEAAEVRAMVDQAAVNADKPIPADEWFKLFDKISMSPISSGALANFIQPIYAKFGVKTGKTRTETLAAPPGRVLASLFCSLARKGRKVLEMHRAEEGCVVTAELQADLWSLAGKLIVAVKRAPSGTQVEGATAIAGQYFDWGKSTRCLDGLFADLRTPINTLKKAA